MPAPLRVLKPSQQPLRGLEFDTGYVEPPGPIPPGPKQKKHEKKRKAAAGEVNSEDELRKKKRAEVPEWKRKGQCLSNSSTYLANAAQRPRGRRGR